MWRLTATTIISDLWPQSSITSHPTNWACRNNTCGNLTSPRKSHIGTNTASSAGEYYTEKNKPTNAKMEIRTTPGCDHKKTPDECRECSDYRHCDKRVHVICGKTLCPWTIKDNIKARCVGCVRTMDCPDRDPSLVRAFPKLRKNIFKKPFLQ